jgi:hypothetical protein
VIQEAQLYTVFGIYKILIVPDNYCLISPLFCDVTQRTLVVIYQHFGTTYQAQFTDFSGQPIIPETSVSNYQYGKHNIPEEGRSHLHHSRSLILCKLLFTTPPHMLVVGSVGYVTVLNEPTQSGNL